MPLGSGYQRTAKGASGKGHVKRRQKVSKIFFDTFRHFLCRAKKSQKSSKIFQHFSTIFANFPAPLLGALRRGKGSRLKRGPGSWHSHAQTTHSLRKPRAGTSPISPCQQVQEGGFPGQKGVPARRGVGVPAHGVLRPVSLCEGSRRVGYHEPNTTRWDPSHFPIGPARQMVPKVNENVQKVD